MAVSKSVEKTRLLVRVENTDGSLKNLALTISGKARLMKSCFMRGRQSPDCR